MRKTSGVKFPKRERRRLEAAIKALDELYRRGFECFDEVRRAKVDIKELLYWDDEPACHTPIYSPRDI